MCNGCNGACQKIDLHGMSEGQAMKVVRQKEGQRCSKGQGASTVCYIHGKGKHSKGPPVLKPAVRKELEQSGKKPYHPRGNSGMTCVQRCGR